MTEVSISIKAKVGAASFEIESNPGDVLHHITGPDFMKMLMDLAGYVAPPDAEVAEPETMADRFAYRPLPPVPEITEDGFASESSMGSVDSFIAKGGRRTDIGDGRVMEEEPIFTPEETAAPVKTFGNRSAHDPNSDDPIERREAEAKARLRDDSGWATT